MTKQRKRRLLGRVLNWYRVYIVPFGFPFK